MTPEQYAALSVDEAARFLYNNNANRVKPAWDQLGGVTQGVWKEYVLSNRYSEWPFPRAAVTTFEKEAEKFPEPVAVPKLTLKERLALKGL